MYFKSARYLAVAAGLAFPLALASADVTRTFRVFCQQPAYEDDQGRPHAMYDGFYDFNLDTPGQWTTGPGSWTLNDPWPFYDDFGYERGSIDSLTVMVVDDPIVTLNFSATAGFASTTFLMNSPVLSFPTLQNPTVQGRASVGISITDSPLNGVGGSLTGLYGGKAYRPMYEGLNIFQDLLSSFGFGPGTTTVSDQSTLFPLFDPIAGNVSDIRSSVQFALSPFDRASVTSSFQIIGEIPAPGAAGLLGLGVLALARRRSR